MTTGIIIRNPNDFVQLDEAHSTFTLHTSGSLYTGSGGGWSSPAIFTPVQHAIVLFKPPINVPTRINVDTPGYIYAMTPQGVPATIPWRIYVPQKHVHDYLNDTSYGLEIFDEVGLITFNSNYSLLRIGDTGTALSTGNNGTENYVTMPSPGFHPWICCNNCGSGSSEYYENDGNPYTIDFVGAAEIAADYSVTVGTTYWGQFFGGYGVAFDLSCINCFIGYP